MRSALTCATEMHVGPADTHNEESLPIEPRSEFERPVWDE